MRDFFRGPALDPPAKLWPTGRRNRKLPGMILLSLLVLLPLGWLFLQPGDDPAPVAEHAPVVVVPPSPATRPPSATPPTSPSTSPSTTPPVTRAPRPSRTPTHTPAPVPTVKKLKQATLAPGRTVKCARVIIAIDQSNSMEGYTSARDNALRQLVEWGRRNLSKRDEIAVVDFAGDAGVRLSPTSARALTQVGPAVSLFGGSHYRPILGTVGAFPKTRCKTALVLLSDGDLTDLPTDASESGVLLRGAAVKFQRLLVPDPTITVPDTWATAFPNGKPVLVDGMNPDETARIIGETIAKIVNTTITYH